jgi:hypothetical protein
MSKECLNLDEMYKLGGSSGGARPKFWLIMKGNHGLLNSLIH